MKTKFIIFDNFLQRNLYECSSKKMAKRIIFNLENNISRVGRYKIIHYPVVKGVRYDF